MIVGRKPKLSAETLAAVAASLALRESMPTLQQWARKLGMSKSGLRRAVKEGCKNHRAEACQSRAN